MQHQQQQPLLSLGGGHSKNVVIVGAGGDRGGLLLHNRRPKEEDAPASSYYTARDSLAAPRWRSLVDNMVVEMLASLLVSLATVLCWTTSNADTLQFVPSLVLGLVLICIKDEDYFFPDTSPTVTLVLWILGGYTWIHVLARVVGQLLGFAIALWICLYATVPPLVYRVEHTTTVVFALELIGTALEHMAVVYVILPLLPPAHHHHQQPQQPFVAVGASSYYYPPPPAAAVGATTNQLRKVKPKSHPESKAPSNPVVLHAAIAFSGLHWCLSRGFCIEMTPIATALVAILRAQSLHEPFGSIELVWTTAAVSLWAQAVGVLLCVAYVALFAPREPRAADPSPNNA